MKISEHQWGNFSTFEKRVVIMFLKFQHLRCKKIHPAVCFALRTSFISFALLFVFPLEPMTIPAVLGSALSISLIINAL